MLSLVVDTAAEAYKKLPESEADQILWAGLLRIQAVRDLSLIHISEPTRPLYISYAVFCLKKIK